MSSCSRQRPDSRSDNSQVLWVNPRFYSILSFSIEQVDALRIDAKTNLIASASLEARFSSGHDRVVANHSGDHCVWTRWFHDVYHSVDRGIIPLDDLKLFRSYPRTQSRRLAALSGILTGTITPPLSNREPPSSEINSPLMKFIAGDPIKPATNMFAGRS